MNSLRRTLLVSLLSAIAVVFGVAGYATYRPREAKSTR